MLNKNHNELITVYVIPIDRNLFLHTERKNERMFHNYNNNVIIILNNISIIVNYLY